MANKSTDEEQQRETSSSPLPSYGLSKFCDITDRETVRSLMDGISQGTLTLQNMQRVNKTKQEEEHSAIGNRSSFGSTSSETASSSQEEVNGNGTMTYFGSVNQEGGINALKVEQMENSYVLHFFGNIGSTECIQTANLETVDQLQLQGSESMGMADDDQLFGEGVPVAMEVTVVEGQADSMEGFLDPKVSFTDVAKYSRFRYQSERPSKMAVRSTKGKNGDHADDYKSLGTVKIEGYHGRAHLTIFCVDGSDRIHPYSLHGEHCVNGIYQQVLDLKSDRSVKLNKVTFTTPKSKQYKEIFKKRKEELQRLNVDVHKMKNTDMDKSDKNTVYLHVDVLFEDLGTRKHAISDAIHNKKEGHEFKIYRIEPPSAPATGYHPGNPDKRKILIVLTEATACPKNLAVKIKSRTGQPWEVTISKKDVAVLRKSVVEFLPPPFWNEQIDSNEECEVSLVDLDTKDETNKVTFLYYSVQDLEDLERKRKKPRLTLPELPQLSSGASGDVLNTLDQRGKRSTGGQRGSLEGADIPKYSEVLFGKQKEVDASVTEKVYSLKDSGRNEGLMARGPSRTAAQTMEESSSRAKTMSRRGQSPAIVYGRPELQQSQLTVPLPTKTGIWPVGSQSEPQSITSQMGTTSCAIVTSASSLTATTSVDYTSIQPIAAVVQPTITSAQEQSMQTSLQQLQQHTFMTTEDLDLKIKQLMLQQQEEELRTRQQQVQQKEAELQAQQQVLQQQQAQLLQQQQQQNVNHQQQQMSQQLVAASTQQQVGDPSLIEKRRKHELLSTLLEKEAKKMNPTFQLPPDKMFLILGDKITIADRSLMDTVFASLPNTQVNQNIEPQFQGFPDQSTHQLLGAAAIFSEQAQSARVNPLLYSGQGQAATQQPPLVQQTSYPPLQNMSTLTRGDLNPYQNPSSQPFQQHSSSPQALQRGTSVGHQPGYSASQGTRNPQSLAQPRKSVFPRNNLPFSPANLDDDDVEIDSEGPKRKKPVQLCGGTAKKAANGFTMKNNVQVTKESSVIDLTVENMNKICESKVDLNDEDLEIDCYDSESFRLTENRNDILKEVVHKMNKDKTEKYKRLSGLYIGDDVRREALHEIAVKQVDDSGIFSMPEEET